MLPNKCGLLFSVIHEPQCIYACGCVFFFFVLEHNKKILWTVRSEKLKMFLVVERACRNHFSDSISLPPVSPEGQEFHY